MPTQDDIAAQEQLLAAHRQTLAILLDQRVSFTPRNTPPAVANGIIEARREIAKVKQTLRDWGVAVVDLPIDVERAIDTLKLKLLLLIETLALPALVILLVGSAAGLWLYLVPAKMPDGHFNVAVAEFSQIDSQGRIIPTDDSKLISSTLFTTIQQRFNLEPPSSKPPLVWHDSMNILQKRVTIGMIASDSSDACQQRASDLNANIIVYGILDARTNPAQLYLQFCAQSGPANRDRDTGNLQELQGVDRLGSPIRLRLPIDQNAENTPLLTRTDLLARLVVGLRYELADATDFPDSFRDARTQFEAALKNLGSENSIETNGGYLIYYFIGRENYLMFQDPAKFEEEKPVLLEKARAAFQRAIELNPKYARAWTALGGVYFLKARQDSYERRPAADDLAHSIDAFQKAIPASQAAQERSAEAEARLVLAETYWLQADSFLRQSPPDVASAQLSLQQADQQVGSGEALIRSDQNRFQGYAWMVRGLIVHLRAQISLRAGDKNTARAQFEQARGFYRQCIDAGAKDPLDQFLQRQIVQATCQPKADNITKALQQMQQ